MLLAPARKRNVQCDARRRHRRCRYENRTSARPVGSSRIRLHGVAGARKRGAMSLPGNHVGSRQCAIRPESRVKQTCQGYRSTDANDPQRSLTRSRFAAVEKCLAFVSADACQSNAFPGSLSIADSISRAAEPNIPQHPIVERADHCPPFTPQCVGATRLARYPREQAPAIATPLLARREAKRSRPRATLAIGPAARVR